VPTESTVVDVSRLDWCKLGDGAIYTSIKNQLDAKNGGRSSNAHDALIAEVAVINRYTLLTADADLSEVTKAHNGAVRNFAV
jgi:predicted nucleic acid-binding protein